MKKNRQSWEDFLFENRNKAYGAYELRTNAGRNLLKSLLVIVFSVGIAITAFSSSSKDVPVTFDGNRPPIHNLTKIDEFGQKIPPKKVDLPPPPKVTVKEKSGEDVVPTPKADPPVEHPLAQQTDLGITKGDEDSGDAGNPGALNPISDPNNTGNSQTVTDQPDPVPTPDTPKTMNSTQVTKMAVFPGCEKSKTNQDLTNCMATKLSQELGIELRDFEDIANKYGIDKANAKLSFVVDRNGKIIQVQAMSGGNKELSAEAQKALNKISKKLVQKGKYIKPAETDDGTAVNLIFNIPIRFDLK
ncbi:MAG: hypothetical protein WBF83_05765 [Moheibacter sp.]